jgi:hypothetical protein
MLEHFFVLLVGFGIGGLVLNGGAPFFPSVKRESPTPPRPLSDSDLIAGVYATYGIYEACHGDQGLDELASYGLQVLGLEARTLWGNDGFAERADRATQSGKEYLRSRPRDLRPYVCREAAFKVSEAYRAAVQYMQELGIST